jgi:cell division protein FtsB
MQNEEKTLELFLSNLAAHLGKQAYRIVELETVLEARNQEIAQLREELREELKGKNK